VLATKLYIPPTRSELVSRPRLIKRLDEGLQRKLTLISAPTGFGKTMLLAECMAKIVLNSAIQVVSGDISGFVYRHQADGSVVVAKAGVRHGDYEPSPAQVAQMQSFKEASARYTRLMQEADVREAYEKVLAAAGPSARLRAMVIGDILSAPTINTLDLSLS
jgi:hypothetical protein